VRAYFIGITVICLNLKLLPGEDCQPAGSDDEFQFASS
jgi:hypothetical protein